MKRKRRRKRKRKQQEQEQLCEFHQISSQSTSTALSALPTLLLTLHQIKRRHFFQDISLQGNQDVTNISRGYIIIAVQGEKKQQKKQASIHLPTLHVLLLSHTEGTRLMTAVHLKNA